MARIKTICLIYFIVKTEDDENICKLGHRAPSILKFPDGCESESEVSLTECRGNCESSTIAKTLPEGYGSKNCKCCKPSNNTIVTINLICKNGNEITKKTADLDIITECGCGRQACESTPSHANEVFVNQNGEIMEMKKKRRRRALSRLFALPP